MDKTGKINFTMKIISDTGLELRNLKLKIVEAKIRVDVFAKCTSRFSYTTPSTCYPKKNIYNIPKDIARYKIRAEARTKHKKQDKLSDDLLPPIIQHFLSSTKLSKIIYLFFTLIRTRRNFFHLTHLLQYTEEKES